MCDTARDVVTEVLAEPTFAASVGFEELSLEDDPDLAEQPPVDVYGHYGYAPYWTPGYVRPPFPHR